MATFEKLSRPALVQVALSSSIKGVQKYGEHERALFEKFLPYSFSDGRHFNASDTRAALDANQRLFNVAVKLDHTYAAVLPKGDAEVARTFLPRAKPIAAALESLSGYKLPHEGKLDVYSLKNALLASLLATIELLLPGRTTMVLPQNYGKLPKTPYLRYLNLYSKALRRHFSPGTTFILYGSAARGEANPSDADYCCVVPSLDANSYNQHMIFAINARAKTQKTLPLTFSMVPAGYFGSFALSDADAKFFGCEAFVSGKALQVPIPAAPGWHERLSVVSALQGALRLREALANWSAVSDNPKILKARLNEPFYALALLTRALGAPQKQITLPKFSACSVNVHAATDDLLDANLAMQEILSEYADGLDKA